jgi:hypothetical protein
VSADIHVTEAAPDDSVVIVVGLSNEFGDHAVRPVVNILFGPGAEVMRFRPTTRLTTDAHLGLSAPVSVGGQLVDCWYSDERLELTPGDATVRYFALSNWSAERVLVVVRADSSEFENGRVERAAWIGHDGSSELIAERTA